MQSILKCIVLTVCIGVISTTFAESYRPESPNIEEKTWVEQEVELPAYPKDENLMPFDVSAVTTNKFYVDAKSIIVGDDGVVRYTVVVKSAGGAVNVSFEGIRCNSREWKSYGFGRNDGTWVKAKQTEWQRLAAFATNRHRHELFKNYFCPGGGIIRRPQQAISVFRRGGENMTNSSGGGG